MNDQKNILLIMTDEHCANALSCTGNPNLKTPFLDKLANEGILFSNTYTTQPLCVPSRTALHTGCWPHQTKVMVNAQKAVPDDAPMFPMLGSLLRNQGYRCGHIGKMHIAYRDKNNQRHISLNKDDIEIHGFEFSDECPDVMIPSKAEAFFEENDDRPFFLNASFLNPHDCMSLAKDKDCKEKIIGSIPSNPDELPELPENFDIPNHEPSVIREHYDRYSVPFMGGSYTPYPTRNWDELRWRQYLWGYYRLVELVDWQIGELLINLKKSGKYDSTLIMLTADHGDGAGHHHWYQKQILYEETIRVPFIISDPSNDRKGIVDQSNLISLTDIPPTILDYAGVKRLPHMVGQSLRPLLRSGEWNSHKYVVSETLLATGTDVTGWAGRMLRTPDYKYVVYNHGDPREQLTDMINDPGEMVNLAVDENYKSILDHHRQLLQEWCESTDDDFLKEVGRL